MYPLFFPELYFEYSMLYINFGVLFKKQALERPKLRQFIGFVW